MPLNTPLKTIAIAALSTLAAGSAASAASFNDHAALGYKPSELQTTSGLNSLYRRIENKAASACNTNNARALYAKQLAAKCEATLVEDWVETIGDARLHQTHAQSKSVRSFASLN